MRYPKLQDRVVFVLANGEEREATIVHELGGGVNLVVQASPEELVALPEQINHRPDDILRRLVVYSEEPLPNTWHWPAEE